MQQRLLLHNVPWEAYVAIGDVLADRPAMRLTYDRGNFEIMTTSTSPAPTAWTSDAQTLLLHDIDWDGYLRITEALDRHHLRSAYSEGSLELMSPSFEHEIYESNIGLFMHILMVECKLKGKQAGSTTFRRREQYRGLESDRCYYFKNWPKVRTRKRIDLDRDPPPDLAIEIDVTRSSLDRMEIYSRLKIPEVWRFDGQVLTVYLLNSAGEYEVSVTSPTFPSISIAELGRWIARARTIDDTTMDRKFRAWVRKQLVKQGKPAATRKPKRKS